MQHSGGCKAALACVLACALLGLSGCQTGPLYLSPPLDTRIVDSTTGAPIEGARVTLWSTEVEDARKTATSDHNGMVHLQPLMGRLRLIIPYGDLVMQPAVARFEADGYQAKEINSEKDSEYFGGRRDVLLMPEQSGR